MKFKKFAAAAAAMALLAGAPSGLLPFSLSTTVNAESDYDPSKHFLAEVNYEGEVIGFPDDCRLGYSCEVKDDGTLKIRFDYYLPVAMFPDAFPGKTITIPSEIKGYKVTELSGGFRYFACKKVIIPDTVTTIDKSAFAFSYFLEEIEFGANSKLKFIDQWAFQDCRSLKALNLPASIETIGYQAFCNSTHNDLSGYAYSSGAYDFNDTFSLTTVNIPLNAKLKTIGEGAFANQKSLTSITIPEKTNSIADNAFKNTALKTITGVIGSYAETYADENGYEFIGVPSETEEKPEDPDDGSDDSTKPGDGSDDPTKPGDGSDDPTKPDDGSDNPTNPGNSSDDPTNPGDATVKPVDPDVGAGKPTIPGDGTENPANFDNGTAAPAGSDNENTPGTGIVIAVVPMITAACALVIFKKRK